MIQIVDTGVQFSLRGYKIVALLAWDRVANRAMIWPTGQIWGVRVIDANGTVLFEDGAIKTAQLTFRRHPIIFDGMVSIEVINSALTVTSVCTVIEYYRGPEQTNK